jgi:hypothetical protein
MAWLGEWRYRIEITIDATKVDAALTDFPVLLYLSVASGLTSFNITDIFTKLESDANRKKIAVTTSNGTTECYVEIEKWDTANEQAWLWVKVPSISASTDTILYIYYDKNESDNTTYVGDIGSTPGNTVWDSDYAGVWHMADDPTGTLQDSTSNGRDMTPANMEAGDLVTGKVADGYDFDGSDEYTEGADWFYSNTLTIEAWVEPDSFPVDQIKTIVQKRNSAGPTHLPLGFEFSLHIRNRRVSFGVHDSGNNYYAANSAADSFPASGYGYTCGRAVGVGSALKVNVNDDQWTGANQPTIRNSTAVMQIACRALNDNNRYFDGEIDEVRISKIARSDAWVKASYYTSNDGFLSYHIKTLSVPFGIRHPDIENIKSMQTWLEELHAFLENPDIGKLGFTEQDGNPDEPISQHAAIFLKDVGGLSTLYTRFNNAGGAADLVELAQES